MKPALALLACLAALLLSPSANARELDLSGFQEPSGAITSGFHGDRIDPYFATKGLLLAHDGELDIKRPALAWIKWGLRAQRGDGLFNRYKKDPASGGWIVWETADADDAMLALWLELLYRMAPRSGMPPEWEDSARRAQAQLDALYDKETGVYHISRSLRVGLLMDNTEIYAAYMSIARDSQRLHKYKQAFDYRTKAKKLEKAIYKTFGGEKAPLRITTQERDEDEFYPDRVAQMFPPLYRLGDSKERRRLFIDWRNDYGRQWLDQRNHDFPWGLIAVLALDMNDPDSAACWQNRAEPMRYSGHWNILEEVASQQVKYRLELQQYHKVPCVGGNLI